MWIPCFDCDIPVFTVNRHRRNWMAFCMVPFNVVVDTDQT
jgi:hypothetical protein